MSTAFPHSYTPADFQYLFRRLFVALLVVGHVEGNDRTLLRLSTNGRSDKLHLVLARLVGQELLPDWCRQQLYFESRPDGPYCQELEIALRDTAITTGESQFVDDYTSGYFQLTLGYDQALEYLEDCQVHLEEAQRWSSQLYVIWRALQIADFTTYQELPSATSTESTPSSPPKPLES